MQLESIPKSMQKDFIASFWTMMSELETQANNNDDRYLKHQVSAYYCQWNAVTGDNKSPRWAKEN